ncbi:hypothetical protein M422DRAFT_267368 [Sphaerobolus stellatus SS14]|uniref:Uncharacterized protein n=1 Tax=Sphaerobolus stellatus (strain SS14) TaxID=990650 RepID=A0A0C9TM63_SPHS4|nr:hypothetical protein M422DRAFT_267368 [Sphaerobolus stellatus SS14]
MGFTAGASSHHCPITASFLPPSSPAIYTHISRLTPVAVTSLIAISSPIDVTTFVTVSSTIDITDIILTPNEGVAVASNQTPVIQASLLVVTSLSPPPRYPPWSPRSGPARTFSQLLPYGRNILVQRFPSLLRVLLMWDCGGIFIAAKETAMGSTFHAYRSVVSGWDSRRFRSYRLGHAWSVPESFTLQATIQCHATVPSYTLDINNPSTRSEGPLPRLLDTTDIDLIIARVIEVIGRQERHSRGNAPLSDPGLFETNPEAMRRLISGTTTLTSPIYEE